MATDSISRDILALRAVGQFPISIATSLAIESAVGILPEDGIEPLPGVKPVPKKAAEVTKRGLLLINVRTLVRNLYGSVETIDRKQLDEYVVAEAISNEMRAIETIIAEHSDGRCQVSFYHCSYNDIARKFDRALLKTANTVGQQQASSSEQTVFKYLSKDFKDQTPISQYVRDFPDMHADTMILTHYPIDLLQRYRFTSLVLLESHTGAIKHPIMWNTKLHNGRELEIIPFDRFTLQMFGDGVLFTAMPVKIRMRVYNIAVKNKWTPASTKDLVIHSIEENHDPALEVLVKDLYRK